MSRWWSRWLSRRRLRAGVLPPVVPLVVPLVVRAVLWRGCPVAGCVLYRRKDCPALQPPLAGLLEPEAEGEGKGNVVVGVPPRPAVGSLGEGVCVRCVAARRIESGERLVRRA